MTHNSTHPDRRISIGEQQARRERDQAVADFQRLEAERDEALDEGERLRGLLAEIADHLNGGRLSHRHTVVIGEPLSAGAWNRALEIAWPYRQRLEEK